MKKLYVVGFGPGALNKMTLEARDALIESEVIAGYTLYVDLLKDDFENKEYIVTGMTRERERCEMALASAENGRTTAMICSGDAGVYGMAGICLELSPAYPEVEIEIVPGVTAALSGAAVLGAPLGHDFVVISLSDRLTPWETIEKRLCAAASADFAMCIYNPSSKARKEYLKRSCRIIMNYQSDKLICGYVQNIGREGQSYKILTLDRLMDTEIDMFTTVFIGNSTTKCINNRMVTPRGYRSEPL